MCESNGNREEIKRPRSASEVLLRTQSVQPIALRLEIIAHAFTSVLPINADLTKTRWTFSSIESHDPQNTALSGRFG